MTTQFAVTMFSTEFKPFKTLKGLVQWYVSAVYAGAFIAPELKSAVLPIFNRQTDCLPNSVLREARDKLIELGILSPDSTLGY